MSSLLGGNKLWRYLILKFWSILLSVALSCLTLAIYSGGIFLKDVVSLVTDAIYAPMFLAISHVLAILIHCLIPSWETIQPLAIVYI